MTDVTTIEVPAFIAFTLAMIVFFLGAFLTRKVRFLRDYNIPEPVSGGLAAALLTWLAFAVFEVQINFNIGLRDELLVIFFATIGLNARVSDLLLGGRILIVLLGLTVTYIVVQNMVGLVGTHIFDLPAAVSVMVGSASLIGGHGTAIAWGPTVEMESGFSSAAEIGVAAATLGLVFAAAIGGPIAKFLIDRHRLTPEPDGGPVVGIPHKIEPGAVDQKVDHVSLMSALLWSNIAVIFGFLANLVIADLGLKLPLFVPCLLVGILLSNTVPHIATGIRWPARTKALAVLSDYCLSVFLAMSLMSLQLWTLVELGIPLIAILLLQVIAAIAFILLFVFVFMGRDYTAAVLSAGFAGFALGATPTAIANMSSVTKAHGPAPLAFIILPLVSAFFVDLANAFIIRYFVGL